MVRVVHEHQRRANWEEFSRITQSDHRQLLNDFKLEVRPSVEHLIFEQTLIGHSQQGHGVFAKEGVSYPNATLEDVFCGLGHDPEEIKERRFELISEIFDYVDRVISGARPRRLANRNGSGLAGIDFPNGPPIITNPLDVLRGMVLGGAVDDYDWRLRVRDKYGHEMGGGECFVIDRAALRRHSQTFQSLARNKQTLEERARPLGLHVNGQSTQVLKAQYIEALENRGIIIPGHVIPTNNRYVIGYVRFNPGKGISDDTAFIHAGVMYSPDFAWGVFLADAVDTWDKAVPRHIRGGWDGYLAEHVRTSFQKAGIPLGLSDDEITDFVHSCAMNYFEDDANRLPDSSQRYFLQVGGKDRKLSAVRNHAKFIDYVRWMRQHHEEFGSFPPQSERRRPYVKMMLGFGKIPSSRFYNILGQEYMRRIKAGEINLNGEKT